MSEQNTESRKWLVDLQLRRERYRSWGRSQNSHLYIYSQLAQTRRGRHYWAASRNIALEISVAVFHCSWRQRVHEASGANTLVGGDLCRALATSNCHDLNGSAKGLPNWLALLLTN